LGLFFSCGFELESDSGFPGRYSSPGEGFRGALANLRAVLVRFREYGLKMKPKKCELFPNSKPVFSNKCRFGAVFRFDFHLPIC
jgi:hypothetical protein